MSQEVSDISGKQISPMANLQKVILNGDLSSLTESDRVLYYKNVCESVGLNPLTKPFEYIRLNNKLVLYAGKNCVEQLRKIHSISVDVTSRGVDGDVYVVCVKAIDKTGRIDSSIGAVPVVGLKGDALANAMMKAETKAKRRVTLSILGLGMLDESEIESIPGPIIKGVIDRPMIGNSGTKVDELKELFSELDPHIQKDLLDKLKITAIEELQPLKRIEGAIEWIKLQLEKD